MRFSYKDVTVDDLPAVKQKPERQEEDGGDPTQQHQEAQVINPSLLQTL